MQSVKRLIAQTAVAASLALVSCAAGVGPRPVAAEVSPRESVVQAVSAVGDHEAPAQVDTDATGSSAIDTQVAGVGVVVPVDPEDGIRIDPTGTAPIVTVGLPNGLHAADAEVVAPGVVSYDNRDGSTSVPVVKTDGSVAVNTVIASVGAPTSYRYPVGAPDGARLTVTEDGGALVTDVGGSLIARIEPAWARDAAGESVPTHFVVDGLALVQVVNHRGPGVTYPVTADPWWGRSFRLGPHAASRLISALDYDAVGVGGVALLCSAGIVGLPCAAVAGLAAMLFGMGVVYFRHCSAGGRGFKLNVTWTGLPWCSSL